MHIYFYLCLYSFFHIQILDFFFPFFVLCHCLCKGLTHYTFHLTVISDSLLVSNLCFCSTSFVLFISHSLSLLFSYMCLLSIQLFVLSYSVFFLFCLCPILYISHPVHASHYMRASLHICPPCIQHYSNVLYLYPTLSVFYSVYILLRQCLSLNAYPTCICPTHVCPTLYVFSMYDLFQVLFCVSHSTYISYV